MEAVIAGIVLAFVISATARLLDVGQRQQRIARDYSTVQTDLRSGLARLTRTLRHGYGVKNPSANPSFTATPNSGTSQLIVEVPQPNIAGVLQPNIEVRTYVSDGTLYIQKSNDVASPISLMTGVTSIQFAYYQMAGTTQSAVDGTPQTANQVKIRLTGTNGQAVTNVEAMVSLRNTLLGF